MYSKYTLYEKNIEKHENKIHRVKITESVIIRHGSEDPDPYQNKTDPKHSFGQFNVDFSLMDNKYICE